MLGKIWDKIKGNHMAMMAVCCLLPVVLIFGLQFWGFRDPWIYPLAIAVCVGSHVVMMALGPKDKEGKSCH